MKRQSLRKTVISSITAAIAMVSISSLTASAEPQLTIPKTLPKPKAVSGVAENVPDQLLVMASGNAEQDEFNESIEAVHGTVVQTIGEGPIKTYVVQVEKGKLVEAEQKLSKDGNVAMVQRNYTHKLQQAAPAANDPFFSSQWNLPAVNVVNAWPIGNGTGAIIGVMDVGVATNVNDLSGKCYAGYDAVRRVAGQTPSGDHGSLVATTAGARTNNRVNTAAVAPGAMIYPIKISNASGVISEAAILEGIYHAGTSNIRILNLSANSAPPYSLSARQYHPAFHTYADWYHNQRNGLLIVSSGNEGMRDSSPFSPNIMVVSAIGTSYTLAGFSNYGNNIWFTAPGAFLYCTTASGRVANVSGTSFSAPTVAAIAAIVHGKNRNLRNVDIERILRTTCYKAYGQTYTPYYGYGLPNGEAAVKAAR